VQNQSFRVFIAVTEWTTFACWVVVLAWIAPNHSSMMVCWMVIATLLVLGASSILNVNTITSKVEWARAGLIIGILFSATLLVWEFSLFAVLLPLIGLLYTSRLVTLGHAENPSRHLRFLFRVETLCIPLFIYYAEFNSVLSSPRYLPKFALALSAIVYVATRLISLIVVYRYSMALRHGLRFDPIWFRLSMLLTIGIVGIIFLSPLIVYYSIIGIGVVLGQMGAGLLGLLGIGMRYASRYHSTPGWVNVIYIVIILSCAYAAALLGKRFLPYIQGGTSLPQRGEGTSEHAIVHSEQFEKEWVGKRLPRFSLSFRQTTSTVRKNYQAMLRMMERRGFPIHKEETPREYLFRLESEHSGVASNSLMEGVRLLTNAYEKTRYTSDSAETDESIAVSGQGLQFLKSDAKNK